MLGSVGIGVNELTEKLSSFWIVNNRFPFAFVRIDEVLHLAFELGIDAESIVDHDIAQLVDSTF